MGKSENERVHSKNEGRLLNNGLTLIELLGVLIILVVIALITFPIIDNAIKNSREKSLERTIDSIEEAAHRYSIENDLGYPTEKQALYLSEIQSKGFLETPIINPVTNEELSGCVWYYWETNYNQYIFEYDSECVIVKPNLPESISFAEDSWETIAAIVNAGLAAETYNVGDTKEVEVSGYGTFTVRIANMSTPTECLSSDFSQTACGFVIEFVDIITTHEMGLPALSWPESEMYDFVNNNIYSALSTDLKSVIIDIKVVSSHGTETTTNYTSTDKLYLLATKEIWEKYGYDTSDNYTRQLDYYNNIGVTPDNYVGAIKTYNGSNTIWWLRSALPEDSGQFYNVNTFDYWNNNANNTNGVVLDFC